MKCLIFDTMSRNICISMVISKIIFCFFCFSNVLIYFLIKSADSPSRMVKLNIDLILGGILSYTKKTRDESLNHFLSRLTHLHLEGRQLDDIVSFSFTLSNSNNKLTLPEPLMTRNWTE